MNSTAPVNVTGSSETHQRSVGNTRISANDNVYNNNNNNNNNNFNM